MPSPPPSRSSPAATSSPSSTTTSTADDRRRTVLPPIRTLLNDQLVAPTPVNTALTEPSFSASSPSSSSGSSLRRRKLAAISPVDSESSLTSYGFPTKRPILSSARSSSSPHSHHLMDMRDSLLDATKRRHLNSNPRTTSVVVPRVGPPDRNHHRSRQHQHQNHGGSGHASPHASSSASSSPRHKPYDIDFIGRRRPSLSSLSTTESNGSNYAGSPLYCGTHEAGSPTSPSSISNRHFQQEDGNRSASWVNRFSLSMNMKHSPVVGAVGGENSPPLPSPISSSTSSFPTTARSSSSPASGSASGSASSTHSTRRRQETITPRTLLVHETIEEVDCTPFYSDDGTASSIFEFPPQQRLGMGMVGLSMHTGRKVSASRSGTSRGLNPAGGGGSGGGAATAPGGVTTTKRLWEMPLCLPK